MATYNTLQPTTVLVGPGTHHKAGGRILAWQMGKKRETERKPSRGKEGEVNTKEEGMIRKVRRVVDGEESVGGDRKYEKEKEG